MGLSAIFPVHARHRAAQAGRNDCAPTQTYLRAVAQRSLGACLISIWLAASCGGLAADTLRIASYNLDLARDGPGLFLRDLKSGGAPDIEGALAILLAARADIVALQGIDYDHDLQALTAFADLLRARGLDYPYRFSLRPNTGRSTGLDMDGDGRTGRARDAQGYGSFAGQGGMALLSRYPIVNERVQDYSEMLWADLPLADLPVHPDGAPFPSSEAREMQRLSTTGHWVVPVALPDGSVLHLMTFHASPPVFDGPEDRNGKRNADEILFWQTFLDGELGVPPEGPFVILGDFNLDPVDGDGRKSAIRRLLSDKRLQDPKPRSPGAASAEDPAHTGDPALDTVDWPDGDPGNLRVDYVLPSSDLRVAGAGVLWPGPGDPLATAAKAASRHRLVWVDLVP